MLIYYLDDEQHLCEIFKEYIEDKKTKVEVFTNSNNAIEQTKFKKPDLMVIDYRLADSTGDEVAKKIDKTIKKILVTGELSFPDVKGFEVMISKPYQLVQIQSLINEYR